MEWDDEADDGPLPPLLPPEDRLWRHPSEVAGAASRASAASASRRREPRLTTIVGLTSTISVLLTLGLVVVVHPARTHVAVEHLATPSGAVTGVADVAAIAERLRPSITRVQADAPDGRRWGSGVLYRSDGMLLTSHHVVDGATALRVSLDDGRELVARLVGADPDTDIALLDVDGERFEVATLGTVSGLKVGQQAITIGTGTPSTGAGGPVVSVGVVSATGQSVDVRGAHLLDMIQTDAAVASGCAGGAVVDSTGVVIGIASTSTATAEGGTSGYATPIDVARVVAAQLLTHGKVTRGWLGVEGDDLPADRAKGLGVAGGVVVKTVRDASPAVSAGIAPADVITAIDGEPIHSMSDLVVNLRTHRAGDTIALAVVRGTERRTAKATLTDRP
jgi:S1-C subfamily serine protease